MDLTPAFSQDYLSWDGVEPAGITYESARRAYPKPDPDPLLLKGPPVQPFDGARIVNANQADVISVAKRRALTRKELAASQGAYQAGDLVWLLPAAVLPSWLLADPPKPGDVVIPRAPQADAGSRYTALDVTAGKYLQTYRLTTRNLAIAYDLRDQIVIERPEHVTDESGAIRQLYPSGPPPNGGEVLYANLLCKVHLEHEDIAEERGIRGPRRVYSIIVSREVAVTNYNRVILPWSGAILEIRGYHNAQRIDELPFLECEQAV